jgi:hypothetical protein
MAGFDVVQQRNDIILKYVAAALPAAFLRRFRLPFPPIAATLPSELPILEVRAERTDVLCQLVVPRLLHLEFQSTQRADDLRRFAAYDLSVYERYGQPVDTVVLYSAGITSAPSVLETGSLTYRVHVVLLEHEDGTAAVHRLFAKVQSGGHLTEEDRVDLMLMPLMRQSAPLAALLPEIAAVVQALPAEQQAPTVGALAALARHGTDDEVIHRLLEVTHMARLLEKMIDEGILKGMDEGIRRGLAEGEARGRAEGEAHGRAEAILVILSDRFGEVPADVEARVRAERDSRVLEALLRRALHVSGPGDLWPA